LQTRRLRPSARGPGIVAAGITKPVVTFTVVVPEPGATLTAVERCNLHGLWQSEPVKLG
jgi:desulfoferrodoxin (superoxide reductase-like protein)